jgi:hypothetical protein
VHTGGLKAAQASSLSRGLGLFGRFGAVGCTATLTLAVVLAGILTTALSLAVILAFAGVLGNGSVLNEHDTGAGGGRGTICLRRLSVQTDRGAAHQTCNSGGQCERLYGILHRYAPFFQLGHTRSVLDVNDCCVDRSEFERSAGYTRTAHLVCRKFERNASQRLHRNMNEPLIIRRRANHPDGNKYLSFAQSPQAATYPHRVHSL